MIRDEKNRVRGSMIVATEAIALRSSAVATPVITDIYDSENIRAVY